MNYLTKFFGSSTKEPEKKKVEVDDMLERMMP